MEWPTYDVNDGLPSTFVYRWVAEFVGDLISNSANAQAPLQSLVHTLLVTCTFYVPCLTYHLGYHGERLGAYAPLQISKVLVLYPIKAHLNPLHPLASILAHLSDVSKA